MYASGPRSSDSARNTSRDGVCPVLQTETRSSAQHSAKDVATRVSTEMMMIEVKESPGGTTFAVKVRPRAKLALTAPPVDGKANEACIEFFAKLLNLPRSSVTIAAGQTSRNKVIRVTGVTAAQLRERLGLTANAGEGARATRSIRSNP